MEQTLRLIDEANRDDPNMESEDNQEVPAALLYGRRMSAWVDRLKPEAPEALQIAARAQHIRRWEIPRKDFPMDRAGYFKWRTTLYGYHGEKAAEIMEAAGYDDETFERVYGPPTHAFQVGRVHFIVLDDVVYAGRGEDGASGPYAGGLTDDQLVFISGYLAGVRRSDLIVLVMHIPLLGPFPHQVPQRRELMEILSRHPNTLSLSAHMHMQQMHFLGPEDGWTRPEPHPHMNLGTTSGSWWRGAPDEQGIPHATMRCGAPNGYWIFEFDGNDYRARFKAARRPASYQMEIHAPDSTRENASSKTEVVVNFFAGSSHAELEMRVSASGPWLPLEHVERQDPGYAELFEREKSLRPPNGWGLPPRVDSPHIWAAKLPADLPPGTHWLEVRARDRFGAMHHARRLLRVLPAENSD